MSYSTMVNSSPDFNSGATSFSVNNPFSETLTHTPISQSIFPEVPAHTYKKHSALLDMPAYRSSNTTSKLRELIDLNSKHENSLHSVDFKKLFEESQAKSLLNTYNDTLTSDVGGISLPPPVLRDLEKYNTDLKFGCMGNFLDKLRPKVSFFTPVVYEKEALRKHGLKGKAVQFFDNYFFLGGKKAFISEAVSSKEGHGMILPKQKESWGWIALKVISYATLIMPAIMLIGKAIARSLVQYKVLDLFKPVNEKDVKQNQEEEKKLQYSFDTFDESHEYLQGDNFHKSGIEEPLSPPRSEDL